MDVIKWRLNFGSCNFGLESFFVKSHVSFQTKLHSAQFNYGYELITFNLKAKRKI